MKELKSWFPALIMINPTETYKKIQKNTLDNKYWF